MYWLIYFIYMLVGLWVLLTAVAFAKHHNDEVRHHQLEQGDQPYDRYNDF